MKEALRSTDLNEVIDAQNGEGTENGVRVCSGNEGAAALGDEGTVHGGSGDEGRTSVENSARKIFDDQISGGTGSLVADNSKLDAGSLAPRKMVGQREVGKKNDGGTGKSHVINAEDAAPSKNLTGVTREGLVRKVESDGNGEFCGRRRKAGEILKSGDERDVELKLKKGSILDSEASMDANECDPGEKIAGTPGFSSKRTRTRPTMGGKEETKADQSVTEREDEGDHGIDFSVGDFVWGKIKSHPWWPGRIFDPSDASEHALKYKHEGRLLVAYFGDGTFAWCNPGQLKPFVENFEEMSKQSRSKDFVNALKEAVDEFGRLVGLEMACSCISKGKMSRSLVFNAGVRRAVNMPDGGIDGFSIALVQPAVILTDVRCAACFVSVPNMFQLTVLKNLLSAFYHAKGWRQLQEYSEPLEIGEEIKTSVEASHRGPIDDSILSPGDDQCWQDMVGTPEILLSRRKEKSIAEILGKDAGETKNDIDNDVQEESRSGKQALESGRKKRKTGIEVQSPGHDNLTADMGRRKTAMLLKNPVAAEKEASKGNDHGTQKEQKLLPSKRKLRDGPAVEYGSLAVETTEKSPHPRERRKSKYLSPPYTSPDLWQRESPKRRSAGAALVFSNIAKMGQKMTRAASQLTDPPPILKCSAEACQKSLPEEVGSKHGKCDLSDPRTPKRDLSSKNDMPMKIASSLSKMLDDIRSAALNPQYPRRGQSFEGTKRFLFSYRSSEYKNGSNHSFYSKLKAEQAREKRNHLVPKLSSEASEPKTQRRRGKQNEEEKSGSKGEYRMGEGTDSSSVLLLTFPPEFSLPSKDDLNKMYRKFGALNDTKTKVFPRSSSAKIFFLSNSDAEEALICSQKSSPFGHAKVSYKIQLISAVSETNMTNENLHPKESTCEHKKAGNSSSKQSALVQSDGESSELAFLRQKLEAMTTMLADGDGKMSQEMKTNLEKEMKELLRKLKM
ncbi:hypothetical protein Ancab_004023 [Ancistrocladus abbreviatus]